MKHRKSNAEAEQLESWTGYGPNDLLTTDDAVLAMQAMIQAGTQQAEAIITVIAVLDDLGRTGILASIAIRIGCLP
jgi:hypothetical protein